MKGKQDKKTEEQKKMNQKRREHYKTVFIE